MDDRERAEHDRFLLGGEAKENRKKVRQLLAGTRPTTAAK